MQVPHGAFDGFHEMGYIDRTLVESECVVYIARRHWLFDLVQHLKTLLLLGACAGLLWLRPRAAEWLRSFMIDTLSSSQTTTAHAVQAVNWGLAVLVCIGALTVIFGNAVYFSHEYVVTNRRVIVKTGFIRRRVFELTLRHVEAFMVNQTVFGRILSYGTVEIRGTGGLVRSYPKLMAPSKFRAAVHAQGEHTAP